MSDHKSTHDAEGRDYQDRDIRIKPILWFGVVMVFVTIATFFGIEYYFKVLASREDRAGQPVTITERQLPPDPTLQIWEFADLANYRAKEQAVLDTYGWVDRDAGIVRLPIEHAMELLLQKGLPVRNTQPTP